jgi:hypothetical protein
MKFNDPTLALKQVFSQVFFGFSLLNNIDLSIHHIITFLFIMLGGFVSDPAVLVVNQGS